MTFLTEAWFWRGTQSAVFYYLSCAPCAVVRTNRKKRKDAKKSMAQKEIEGHSQALPSTTNPGWDIEISVGPGPPTKRLTKKEMRRRDRLKIKIQETMDLEAMTPESSRVGTGSTMATNDGKAVPQGLTEEEDSRWNHRRYQREDEMLWGHDIILVEADADGSPPRRSHAASEAGSYTYHRNPDVNDLHPPVVSAFSNSPLDSQWMLQPPPQAKFMEGKQRSTRSRSDSGTSGRSSLASRGSSRKGRGGNLGRAIGERILEEKYARGEDPRLALSPTSSAVSRGGSNVSVVSSTSGSATATGRNREDTTPSISRDSLAPTDRSIDSPRSMPRRSVDADDSTHAVLLRPHLPTIPSTSDLGPKEKVPRSIQETRPPMNSEHGSTTSLQKLQKVATSLNLSSFQDARNLDIARFVELPASPGAKPDQQSGLAVDDWKPHLDENQAWSFPIPTIELARGKRWSMDI